MDGNITREAGLVAQRGIEDAHVWVIWKWYPSVMLSVIKTKTAKSWTIQIHLSKYIALQFAFCRMGLGG